MQEQMKKMQEHGRELTAEVQRADAQVRKKGLIV